MPLRILVLGLDSPVGYSLQAFSGPLMRHEIVGVSMQKTQWRSERQVKKLIRNSEPDLVLDARLVTQIDGDNTIGSPDIERTAWLARLVNREAAAYLLLSSARVFTGKLTRAYRETDQPDAFDSVGKVLIEAEHLLISNLKRVFILRLGLMFGGRRPNPLARTLDAFSRGEIVKVSENVRGSPVHVAEVARVVHGIIDQMGAGAPTNGLYHYSGIGETSPYAFMECVLSCASQYQPFADARDLLASLPLESQDKLCFSLDGEALRHQFGIQQIPWREFVPRAVRRYIELYADIEGGLF